MAVVWFNVAFSCKTIFNCSFFNNGVAIIGMSERDREMGWDKKVPFKVKKVHVNLIHNCQQICAIQQILIIYKG